MSEKLNHNYKFSKKLENNVDENLVEKLKEQSMIIEDQKKIIEFKNDLS